MYSKEDGTPASKLKETVTAKEKKRRYKKVMLLQKEISKQKLKEKIGKEVEVLIENTTFDGKYLVGRTEMDVPEMDGLCYIENISQVKIGDFVKAKIIDIKGEYDLICEVVK